MRRVYQAANNIEAHMIVHLLEQQGIRAHVQGEHLQSGAGELPVGNLVAVAVYDDGDAERAKAIIREWEQRQPSTTEVAQPAKSSAFATGLAFFIGAVLAGAVVWSIYNGPARSEGADYNEDGKLDEHVFYSGSRIVRVETDRNFDGRVDAVQEYGTDGSIRVFRSDDDFDGRMESTTEYLRGQPHLWRADADGDGRDDYRTKYRFGVFDTTEYLHPTTGAVVKRVSFRGVRPELAQLDRDLDGRWERTYRFDRYDEAVEE